MPSQKNPQSPLAKAPRPAAPAEKSQDSQSPRQRTGQNRQAKVRTGLFKIPVNVPPEVHEYRARNVMNARELPRRLQDTMISYIMAADIDGDPRTASYEQIAAHSESERLRKRFKFEPVTIRQVERHTAELRKLGVLETELVHETYRSKSTGRYESKLLIEFAVNEFTLADYAAAQVEKAVERDEKAKRRAATKAAYNDRQKARRAAATVVESDGDPRQGNNSCGHENGGTSGNARGTAGEVSFVLFPSV
jgi:hypothetical protein